MTRLFFVASAYLLLSFTAPAMAQTAPPAIENSVDSVLVRATQHKRLLTYVQAVSAFSSDGQVARRPDRLCPLVAGAPVEVNAYVRSRIRQVGEQVGVAFAEKTCEPNLLVLFSREPETMLRKARKLRKINFQPGSVISIQKFLSDPRTVRWWHSIVSVPGLGAISSPGDINGLGDEVRTENTRIVPPTRSVIRGSLVVVDASQTDGIEVGALADYVVFTALANIKPDADLAGYSSILNLFSSEAKTDSASHRLTATDLAYLHGVYQARDTAYGMNQVGRIARLMGDELDR